MILPRNTLYQVKVPAVISSGRRLQHWKGHLKMWTPMEPQEATVQPLSSVWRGVSRVVFWALQASAREVHLHVSEH